QRDRAALVGVSHGAAGQRLASGGRLGLSRARTSVGCRAVTEAVMSAGDWWDDTLADAKKALAEKQEQDRSGNSELGDEMTPAEEDYFAGNWRGVGKMHTKDRGEIDVSLVSDKAGRPGFLYQSAGLVEEVNAEKPQVGDEVLVLRGA